MIFKDFEKQIKEMGQKIGIMNKPTFIHIHAMLREGDIIKAVSECHGENALLVTQNRFLSSVKTGFVTFENSVIPLEKINSYTKYGMLQTNLEITEGITIHKYELIANINAIIAAIDEGRSGASQPVAAPAKQDTDDELRKIKALLDDGIITQEDFDKKKAQLLGL
jgi:hypothetical protein